MNACRSHVVGPSRWGRRGAARPTRTTPHRHPPDRPQAQTGPFPRPCTTTSLILYGSMTADDSPFGGSVDVPFSDAALLIVSCCGFAALAVTIFRVIVTRLKTNEEIEKEIGEDETYEDMLKRCDVSTLNRAERRARAHAIMKEKRRANQNEENVGDQANYPPSLSRKERQKAAKAQERAERKLFEKERLEQQRLAQEAARHERLQREAEEARRRLEETERMEAERKEEAEAARMEWETFLSSSVRKQSVEEWLQEMKEQRTMVISDLAKAFDVPPASVTSRIKKLLAENRVTGVLDGECFTLLTEEELAAIASLVLERGSVSLDGIVEIYRQVLEK